jgi:membrane protease YdiL (CAAX protease family)
MSEFLSLARRGKTAWWRYLVTPIAAIALWLAACVVVLLPLMLTHSLPAQFGRWMTDPSHPAYFYGATGVTFGALLASFILVIFLAHRKTFSDIAGRWRWRQTAIGGGVWLAVCVVGAVVDFAVHPAGFRLTAGPQTLVLALWAVPSLAVQTFTEEFIFRGYVTQGWLLVFKRPVVASAVSAVMFAVLHIPNGTPEALNALAFGFFTSLIAIRTGSLAFTAGLHFVNNLFGAVVVVSASDVLHGSPGFFTQATPSLLWFDVAISCVAFAAVCWVAFRWSPAAEETPEAVF